MSVAVSLQRRVNAAVFSLVLVGTTGLVSRCEAEKAPAGMGTQSYTINVAIFGAEEAPAGMGTQSHRIFDA